MNRKERRAAKSLGVDIGHTDVRYGGRTLQVTLVINTDEEEFAVLERTRLAAKGPKEAMCVASVGVMSPEDAREIWERVIPMAKAKAAEGEN